MRFLTQLLFSIAIMVPFSGWADVQLIVWQPHPAAPKIVLPRLDSETPAQAANRYLQSILKHPGLDSLRPDSFRLDTGVAQDLPGEKMAGKVRLALIANRFQHLTPDDGRIQWTALQFSKAGSDPFVIGLSADLGLKEADAIDFRDKVVKNFSLLVSLGGHDITPELYGQKNLHSIDTNATRDRSELALVKHFKKAARGVFFGICRGHQMGAIADGHSLKQDLTETKTGSTAYHGNTNGKDLQEKQTWHHIVFEDSLMARFLLGKLKPDSRTVYSAPVNSVHHQVVDPKDEAASKVIALDDKDATVEALQGKNNKSFSVQFHPEFPVEISGNKDFSDRGFQIIQGIVSYSRLNRMKAPSCSKVHAL